MKLLRLKLNLPFRSLAAGFEVYFLREWDYGRCFEFHPYCLAGRNGSGKSNVLEPIAAIFYHIECIYLDYRPDGFEFDADTCPNGFRAEKANFRNLAPMYNECNSAYKLAKDPTRNIDPIRQKMGGGRRKAFYGYATSGTGITVTMTLKTKDVTNLLPKDIELQITAPGRLLPAPSARDNPVYSARPGV